MKNSFREYFHPNDKERNDIWKNALFVLDTNVLLDFYAFGDTTLKDYNLVLSAINKADQLWMPYHIGYEFFENRVSIIGKQLKQYDNVIDYIEKTHEKISGLSNSATSHSTLDFDSLTDKYKKATASIKKEVESLKKKHPDYLEKDTILEQLQTLYKDDNIGPAFEEQEVKALEKEGSERYDKHIPPGYKDSKKEDEADGRYIARKYGDLAIWKQMLMKAKESNKPIVFVTNDAKEDWIQYTAEKRKIGPKPALKKEMFDTANTAFLLYSSDEFLAAAHEFFKVPLNNQSVEEVKKYRELERDRIKYTSSVVRYRNENRHPSSYGLILTRLRYQRALTQRIYRGLDPALFPLRAMDTFSEIITLYSRASDFISENGYVESGIIVPQLLTVDRLYQRLINIFEKSDESLANNIELVKQRNLRLVDRINIYLEDDSTTDSNGSIFL